MRKPIFYGIAAILLAANATSCQKMTGFESWMFGFVIAYEKENISFIEFPQGSENGIAILGNESGNALLHLAGSKLQNEFHHTLTGSYMPEGQLTDNTVVDFVNIVTDVCQTMKTVNGNIANANSHWATVLATGGASLTVAAIYRILESNWNESYVFWGSEFGANCDKLIGATRYETWTETYWDYVCQDGDILPLEVKNLKMAYDYENCPKVLVQKTRTYKVTITTPSDGLITRDRAIAMPGVGWVEKADDVNHDELKNHPKMFEIFDDIFKGNMVDQRNPGFFKTDAR